MYRQKKKKNEFKQNEKGKKKKKKRKRDIIYKYIIIYINKYLTLCEEKKK